MRRAIYFQGFGEKGHLFSGIWGDFGVLGSREQWAEEKYFRELGRKVIFLSGSREQRPPPPWGGLKDRRVNEIAVRNAADFRINFGSMYVVSICTV